MTENVGTARATEMTKPRIDRLFSYQAPKPEELRKISTINAAAKDLATAILLNCPPGYELNESILRVREAVQTATLSIVAAPD